MSLRVKKQFDADANSWLFEVSGELDLETSNDFKDTLLASIEEKKANITLDCKNLSFIDSTGLGILISTYKLIKDDDYAINIKNPKQNVDKLLNITGLNTLFTVN